MKHSSQRGMRRFRRWSRNICFSVGIFLLGYVGLATYGARMRQIELSRRFDAALESPRPAASLPSPPERVAEAALIGRIAIARLGLSAMILEGTDAATLQQAVGHIPTTPLPGQPGNVALAGHRDTFFRKLRDIRRDDEITVTTLAGSYGYRVDSTVVVDPETTAVLDDAGVDTLTLVTCYPFRFVGPAPKRFIVTARRIR